MSPIGDAVIRARAEAADAEFERRLSLMRDHQQSHEATSVCTCGRDFMSTPGRLVHLYSVVAEDAVDFVDRVLAEHFTRMGPTADRETWQNVLRSVTVRAYQRGLAEGCADD